MGHADHSLPLNWWDDFSPLRTRGREDSGPFAGTGPLWAVAPRVVLLLLVVIFVFILMNEFQPYSSFLWTKKDICFHKFPSMTSMTSKLHDLWKPEVQYGIHKSPNPYPEPNEYNSSH